MLLPNRGLRPLLVSLVLVTLLLPVSKSANSPSLPSSQESLDNNTPARHQIPSYHGEERKIRNEYSTDTKHVVLNSPPQPSHLTTSNLELNTQTCHFYNETACNRGILGDKCNGTEHCPLHPDSSHDPLCYVLWEANPGPDGNRVVKLKGCWVGNADQCHDRERCVEHRKKAKRDLFFCCCSGNLCNGEVIHDPTIDSIEDEDNNKPLFPDPTITRGTSDYNSFVTVVLVVTALFGIGVTFYVVYLVTHFRSKMPHFDSIPTQEETPSILDDHENPINDLGPIHLLEEKAQGRFGSVYKASSGEIAPFRLVAVKIFPSSDFSSWDQECKIYRLPQMKHDNILTFLGSEKKVSPGHPLSFWLVTEYLDHGSLYDYLKARVVSFNEMLHIAEGIARGLNRLHEEIPPRGKDGLKPTVAHRDFKSKNVLLKHDLTACIADFGLALIFDSNGPLIEALGQVGTRRYMAPEVLEGAISFSRNSLLAIDMYACGLVLWELASRCSAQDGPVSSYKLPFEEEVGLHPSLEDMQEVVSQQKKRPVIEETWRNDNGLNVFCETISELWDQEAEARITASCLAVRIEALRSTCNPFAPLYSGTDDTTHPNKSLTCVHEDTNHESFAHSPLLVKETCT